jgi:hypothetical protein
LNECNIVLPIYVMVLFLMDYDRYLFFKFIS